MPSREVSSRRTIVSYFGSLRSNTFEKLERFKGYNIYSILLNVFKKGRQTTPPDFRPRQRSSFMVPQRFPLIFSYR